ncbi:aminopeptidase P family protein [Stackebrandtia nassauensis]|uniref:Xaa-Pro aminopeptidase n=1 Tax=Stackebrandtia nassauensis (strain DSM 44728 / CIP 108903 / NRRL B-16338 / NBRC 102104 / LLR-40K-21) TaxID=446470 RepID=D3QAD6_STANL|nr:aminopeptidase P family protein [Stackebrandtia nassauensis]ADD42719.1 peptidase M24 [Stackebrandtia nassauensis DSM 44728]
MSETNAAAAEAAPKSGERSHDPKYPEKFLQFMRTGWGSSDLTGLVAVPQSVRHAQRRDALSQAFPGETLIIPTGAEKVRANDTFFRFRAGSDFAWLTGDYDPEGVLVLSPAAGGHDAVLYRRQRKSKESDEFFRSAQYGELWVGRRYSLDETATLLGIECRDLDELEALLPQFERDKARVLRGIDAVIDAAIAAEEAGRSEDGTPELTRDRELAAVLSELRLIKDEWELEQLQDAVDATVRGFEDVARVIPRDRAVRERLLEGVFAMRARLEGNGIGYDSIVGAGSHATTLHWITNDGATVPGELILMDMGIENNHLYTADVTRTLPVSGRFTDLQRQVYDLVYASQQAGMDAIKPGVDYKHIHQTCMRVLAEGLSDLGILPVSVDEAMADDSLVYRRWTLHGFGHMLGIDVHDCAAARTDHYWQGKLAEGHVLTVEPGLYFQTDDELVPEELRGIGVRIEDDVLVTADGHRNLSDGLPRTSTDVEEWFAARRDEEPRFPG